MDKYPTRLECRNNFIDNCERIRYEYKLTQKQMADILDLSIRGYQNLINGEVDKVGGCTILRLAKYTGLSMESLIGDLSDTLPYLSMFQKLTKPQKRLIQAMIQFQVSCKTDVDKKTVEVPMLVANSEFYDGFNLDTLSYYKYELPVDLYNQYEKEIICAMQLPNSYYTPTFLKGDVIIIGRGRQPRENEIGIFTHNREVHFRKLQIGEKAKLISIRAGIPPIEVDLKTFSKEWFCFGYVIKRMI